MRRALSILLITALVAPLIVLSGCACNNDGYEKMQEQYGGK